MHMHAHTHTHTQNNLYLTKGNGNVYALKGQKKKIFFHLQKQRPECKISHFEQPHLKGLPFFYTTDLIFFFFCFFGLVLSTSMLLGGGRNMNITSKVVVRKDLYLSECPTDLGQFRLRTVQSFGGKKKKTVK